VSRWPVEVKQERIKGKRVNLPHKPSNSQVNPTQVIFRSLPASEIPGGSNQSCDSKRPYTDFHIIYILRKHPHNMYSNFNC